MERPARTVRLFERDWLERLSRVGPLTPLLVWAPVIALLLWRSLAVAPRDITTVAGLAAAGLLSWTLTEYLVHRCVFHLRPRSAAMRRLVFVVHGVHHETPNDTSRLLMPPAAAMIGCAILAGLFWLLLGTVRVQPFLAAFLAGYLVYDYIHLAVHRGCPPTALGRLLWRRHMLHHFAAPDARWGVSSPLWDLVFRTEGGPTVPRAGR